MKKSRVILLCLVIVTYVLTIGGWYFDNEIMFFVCFGCFSFFLLMFSIVAMKGSASDDNLDDSDNLVDYFENNQEEYQNDAEPYEAVPEIQYEAAASDDSVYEESAEAPNDNNIADYQIMVDNLKAELEETKRALDDRNVELEETRRELDELRILLEAAKSKSDKEQNSALSILPKDIRLRDELSTVNIVDIAKSVADELHTAALRAGLRVQVSSGEERIMVRCDEDLIRVLFRNIVDNSIKYMNRQGMLVITLSTIGDDLFVVLKDNGEGLSSDETNHIFELNYQGSNRISGNGLGLAQAKAVVEYYGGNIYAKSNKGGGMGIYIQLPTS
ncbi:MAG: HAMP domain-containing histidine kinase [Lachnospiraceae bacterium]|nr:HAMP domain-containing histidine kinase [Lachnospiraceae bacterium]